MRPRSTGAGIPALLLLALPLVAPPGPAMPLVQESGTDVSRGQNRVDYVVEAALEAETKLLTGRATISWTNASVDTVEDLWFHLYWNAFANNASTFLVESKGRARRTKLVRGFGWQRVKSLRVSGAAGSAATDLTADIQHRAPDDGNPDDRTVFSVDLPEGQAVAPGETLVIEIEWEAQIPRVRRRTGYKDDFLLIAHWLPKLGVYEGGRGWNCHQFHTNTEFFSDYGTYDVTLDLPASYAGRVGGSGVRVSEEVAGERVMTRFRAPSLGDRARSDTTGKSPLVHGFTWTADEDYVVHQDTFQYDHWARMYPEEVELTASALGRDAADLRLRDVLVEVLIQPEREAQWERHFEATCAALFFYGLWFGEYPYEKVTVVDPAWGARAAGGMEYPTLFTAGTRLFTKPAMYTPESVTVHEAGHQFWYGLVGNNEFEAAWLDEGLNSYTDSEALVRHYGEQRTASSYSGLPIWGTSPASLPSRGPLGALLSKFDWPRPLGVSASSDFIDWWRDQPWLTFVQQSSDPRWSDRGGYLASPDSDPIDTLAFEYVDRSSYRTNSYPRPAVALRTLSGVVGRDAFLAGMRNYSEEWRYAHPYPEDFFEAFNAGAGVDVGWYFDEVFQGTGTVDWSVSVEQRKTPKPVGLFPGQDGVFAKLEGDAAEEEQAEEDDSEDEDEVEEDEDAAPRPWLFEVTVRRSGTLKLPLPVEVRFADGSAQRFEWTRAQQLTSAWWRLPLEPGPEKIEAVVLDPERLYYLDEDMRDNQWFSDTDDLLPVRHAERFLTQYTHLLHWFASIGG